MRFAGAAFCLLLCLLLVFAALSDASCSESYISTLKWGSQGTGDGQFDYPGGVAVDSYGNIYVADTYNNRIQKFDPSGRFITKWGSFGSGNGQFNHPYGVAVDLSGSVYVADSHLRTAPYNNRIQKFDPSGRFITKWGNSGSGNGQFNHPYAVAVDLSGSVYVTDKGNDRIQKFDSNGRFISKWGGCTSGIFDPPIDGEFREPSGVAVDSAGNIYVTDAADDRVQKFKPGDQFITLLTKWGSGGRAEGQFNRPNGIAVDSAGNVFVADTGNNRIQKFDSNGRFITKIGVVRSWEDALVKPISVAVDPTGSVYVADTSRHRIQKFVKVTHVEGVPVRPPAPSGRPPAPAPTKPAPRLPLPR